MASIVKRGKSYSVIYYEKNTEGKRVQKWETCSTRKEAQARKIEIESAKLQGNLPPVKGMTMEGLLDLYIDRYGSIQWNHTTYERNTGQIRNYILPYIGKRKLSEITTLELEKYYQDLSHTPAVINPATGKSRNKYISKGTIHDIHKILKSCFKQAVKWELIYRNPASNALCEKPHYEEQTFWDDDQFKRALASCKGTPMEVILSVAFVTTFREGELLALTWDCVNIPMNNGELIPDQSYVTCNKQIQRIKKETLQTLDQKDILAVLPGRKGTCSTVRVIKKPKTESSIRRVYIPDDLAYMLMDLKKKQEETISIMGNLYTDHGFVFTTDFGLPYEPNYIRHHLDEISEENGLPRLKVHELRHSGISHKLVNGMPIKAVQEDAGHSSSATTIKIYNHINDDQRKNASLAVSQGLFDYKHTDSSSGKKKKKDTQDLLSLLSNADPVMMRNALEGMSKMDPEKAEAFITLFMK